MTESNVTHLLLVMGECVMKLAFTKCAMLTRYGSHR